MFLIRKERTTTTFMGFLTDWELLDMEGATDDHETCDKAYKAFNEAESMRMTFQRFHLPL